ncbi:uncharacterized protein MELLADRAFT_110778 [Melampsora larici-populina 98AG31]|uniref:SigF-like NTF2-like domain-containing protein n=1 Tax=Melampsora larici-populina (strain 98AG31 / pathotype 3-4-7) TaxID=747676 RepID=F4S0Y0_MELLP|nr:uncharacterized protein MELLADRAFT_110778 [Melampsora larici-populina 98AG31]EGG01730.1 hypothetical protein MELLADRAFT_110778 [Melampsora larici-populina 98AG31]
MDNPVAEIEDVVRCITEPADASIIVKNVEKYFTHDARIYHPLFNQPYSQENSLEDLKGIYAMLQDDNFPSDLTISGFSKMLPGLTTLNDCMKGTAGFIAAKLGRFLLARGWFGP